VRRLDSNTELNTDDLVDLYTVDGPSLRLSFVSSADGAATVDGRSGGLGSPADRRILALLRDLCDVILVGAGTARVESYGPSPSNEARQARRAALGLSPVPRMALISNRLDIDPAGPLFADGADTIVITHAGAPTERLCDVAELIVAGDSAVDLRLAVAELARRGLTRVHCEGGPSLAGSLLSADVVDELCLTLSPLLAGGSAGRIVKSAATQAKRLELRHVLEEDGALFLRYALSSIHSGQ
jgi:5-amino-6-(5-phosphoribosylamino)uracil reductase